MNWAITADTHFGHQNVIKYNNRPWVTASQMDDGLIENWNRVCTPETVVYHLGDFAFGGSSYIETIINRLNFAHLHVIKGNHDSTFCRWYRNRSKAGARRANNVTLYDSYLETYIGGNSFTLCHYAMRVWNRSHHGAIHLYGHSHGSLPDDPYSRSFDVGVDCHNYTPLTLQQVSSIIATKKHRPIDHHE